MRVLSPGMLTAVQDWPGRIGHWQVGVPPSGPMDDLSFRLGNRVLGNPEGAPGLESVVVGPSVTFSEPAVVCVAGAPAPVAVDGRTVRQWEAVRVPAGAVLSIGRAQGPGLRVYLLVAGGFDVPAFLGSAATFTLGQFGGHEGRLLVAGDELRIGPAPQAPGQALADGLIPAMTTSWHLAVAEGPHGAPEFFTRADIDQLFATDYEVHFNSDRTGVRLIGPKPRWARADGGEAGLHPSNIHDTAYMVGALDFTGDTPILLGPDGPSLGGFVCPVTVTAADRWKLGQLKAGDTVRFVPVRAQQAASPRSLGPARRASWSAVFSSRGDGDDGVLARREGQGGRPEVTYRRSGERAVLVEYGPMLLDLALRARVHLLHQRLLSASMPGLVELVPGIRSLQIQTDPEKLPTSKLLAQLAELEDSLEDAEGLVLPSRSVSLPLSWDDPSAREAMERYRHGVRAEAPWLPWNIEFIRRINGLDSTADVRSILFDASYLVLGLGDVYLGAPVATPTDPRHRLVTTKYNPARTWTPENAVGIGGAYLCVYGMEGPGGYQLVGRTVQMWNHRHPEPAGRFEPGVPWLLRFFDRISWRPVSAEELADLRADLAAGRGDGGVRIEEGSFSLAEHRGFLAEQAESIDAFQIRQRAAFQAEREAWSRAGEFA
ncbi:MAG: 5-oxoprolinase/urea amidolyase family protein [Segniliparus sp.]|uniref:5-oxoprolinase/urea amidolyase family protein n=1 Tax=Segniliparus sp. TaxID=2804064 RepID=UPI003F305F47